MQNLRRHSLVDITVDHLRQGIATGRWKDHLPGVRPLALELGISKETLRAALAALEKTGELRCQGAGRFRQLTGKQAKAKGKDGPLRIAILLRLPLDEQNSLTQSFIHEIASEIEKAGHISFIAEKYVKHPGRDGSTLEKLVAMSQADAWVAYGASFEVLSWFSNRKIPILSLGGHPIGLSLPCVRSDLTQALHDAVRTLVQHRHRRIVLITTEKWLKPKRNGSALAFCKAMEQYGLSVSDYNLPDWEKSAEGMVALLNSLFKTTPPTALIILEPAWTAAALGFLLRHGLRVPEDVSLITMITDPVLKLWQPPLAHFHWRTGPHIQHLLKWLESLVHGTEPPGLKNVPVAFVPAESIGRAVRA